MRALWLTALVLVGASCVAKASSALSHDTSLAPSETSMPQMVSTSAVTESDSSTTLIATTLPNVYAATAKGQLTSTAAKALSLVYVPSNDDGTVAVIDQRTLKQVARYKVGAQVQHVVPSRDMTTLYANASGANQLVVFDPQTGKPGRSIPVDAPYNLYFSPDGKRAIVMAERLKRIDYYDPTTWKKLKSLPVPCSGVNHADWSRDLGYFLVTCEFSGELLKMDAASGDIVATLRLKAGAMPQDIRLAPDGSKFYVADMSNAGLWIVNGDTFAVTGFVSTGTGAHGIYPSRDGTLLYISNRGRMAGDITRRSRPGEGSVSVLDYTTDTVTETWTIPGGGSPDMGGVTANGDELWLSGRYDSVVYVFDTATGTIKATIPTVTAPHGLAVFPQPGAFSLGHTGNYR